MKKYIIPMLMLSISGAVISCVLLYQHYFPDFEIGFISCRTSYSNPCITVGQSVYSHLFGIPVAAFGMLCFIILTFLILIADYAKDRYYKIFCGIAASLLITGLLIDIVLGVLMIKIGQLCRLCVATYIINLGILIILILFIKNNFSVDEIKKSLKSFFFPKDSDGKTILALSIIFVFCISVAILSVSNIIKSRSVFTQSQNTNKYISNFYNQKEEQIEFPASNMIIGKSDARLNIYIFNDFLCSACRKLYEIEKYIIQKYEGKVRLIYYHYPLDRSCNNDMEETIYPNSCLASKSMHAAAEAGFFEEYFYVHFANYGSYKDSFGIENVNENLNQVSDQFKIRHTAIERFNSIIKSDKDIDLISKHIESAKKLKIESTPTIYISGRKLVGVPTKEILESIIDEELKK